MYTLGQMAVRKVLASLSSTAPTMLETPLPNSMASTTRAALLKSVKTDLPELRPWASAGPEEASAVLVEASVVSAAGVGLLAVVGLAAVSELAAVMVAAAAALTQRTSLLQPSPIPSLTSPRLAANRARLST